MWMQQQLGPLAFMDSGAPQEIQSWHTTGTFPWLLMFDSSL